jgi:hypothetical protein
MMFSGLMSRCTAPVPVRSVISTESVTSIV